MWSWPESIGRNVLKDNGKGGNVGTFLGGKRDGEGFATPDRADEERLATGAGGPRSFLYDQIPHGAALGKIKLPVDLAKRWDALRAGDVDEELLDGADDVLVRSLAGGQDGERGGRFLKQWHPGSGYVQVAVEVQLDKAINEFAGMRGDEALFGDVPFHAATGVGVEAGEASGFAGGDGEASIMNECDEFGGEVALAPQGVELASGGLDDDLGFVEGEGTLAGAGEAIKIIEREGDGLEVDDGGNRGTPAAALGVFWEREGGLGEGRPVGEEGGPGEVGGGRHCVRV